MKPLIGITTANRTNQYGWRYHQGYAANAEAIMRAGGLPVYLPLEMPVEVTRATYERLDGVLLPGGGDIDPARYGADRHELSTEIDAARDEIEMQLAAWAIADDLPTLGICRGHQVLNVALGGELLQDIGTEMSTDVKHDVRFDLPRNGIAHSVEVKAGSRLADALGQTTVEVNSLHHQAVVRVGEGVVVTAQAVDGVVEGVELPDHTFIMSVQWHPEDLIGHEATADRLFAAFVEAARARMAQPSK